ncbi:MAG: class I SAM-dependent methyltransferase [Thermoanaerobaculia bacterium]|nr:class I SAM-dependent methyltransferase [Thermoanaerobaculia bacterium]
MPRATNPDQLLDLLGETKDVDPVLSPADEMLYGSNLGHYLSVGQSALRCIRLGLLSAGRQPSSVRRILDLPCGHGRVTRTLRAEFPTATITACDLVPDAVDFCAANFGAVPVYSKQNLEEIELEVEFDLIWCGSLLTHLDAGRWRQVLNFFEKYLTQHGVLLFSSHGRSVPTKIARGWDYGLEADQLEALVRNYRRCGFSYEDYRQTPGYGISVASPHWVMELLEDSDDLRILSYSEDAWDAHHDVVTLLKGSVEPIPGPRATEHTLLDFGS